MTEQNTFHSNRTRYYFLDFFRGIAVVLMIIFHFTFDLDMFKFVDVDFFKDPLWFGLPRLIVTLFMIAVGTSMALVHQNNFNKKSYLIRLLKIGVCAIGITISTYFMFPKAWVYFGTLHCIFFPTIIITPFVKMPKLSLAIGMAILFPLLFGFEYPFFRMKHAAMDYIPIFPWAGLSYIGIFLYHQGFHRISLPKNILTWPLIYLGKHALVIYLIHQPILYGLTYAAYVIIQK